MATVFDPAAPASSLAEWAERLGGIPVARIRMEPPPGVATEKDACRVNEGKDGLCELIEGVLVEKAMGAYEAYLAGVLLRRLGDYAERRGLGVVFAPDLMTRVGPRRVRLPDVSFLAGSRLPGGDVPREAILSLPPDLAVEVISLSNTDREMRRKLADYFSAGVRLVWFVYPETREARVFTAPDAGTLIGPDGELDGGEVLPGFRLPLAELFAPPKLAPPGGTA